MRFLHMSGNHRVICARKDAGHLIRARLDEGDPVDELDEFAIRQKMPEPFESFISTSCRCQRLRRVDVDHECARVARDLRAAIG